MLLSRVAIMNICLLRSKARREVGFCVGSLGYKYAVSRSPLIGPGEERHEGRRNTAGLWHRWYCEIHDAQADYSLHNCSFVRLSQGPSKWDHLTPCAFDSDLLSPPFSLPQILNVGAGLLKNNFSALLEHDNFC